MIVRLHLQLVLLIASFACGCGKNTVDGTQGGSVGAITNASNNQSESKLADEPPDVLSATNLAQWKSLIRDLKQDGSGGDHWATARFRAGTPPVILKHHGQSIIYKAAFIDVSVVYRTTNLLGAQIYSSRMNIDETRELGLKLCTMFGFDSNEFLSWCDRVGNNWLDAPLFGIDNPSHPFSYKFNVGRSYNDNQPWYIILAIPQESAVLKLMGEPLRSNLKSTTPSKGNSPDYLHKSSGR